MNHDLFRADMKERGITLTQPGESRFFTNFLMMQELVKCKAVVQAVIIAPRAVLYQKNLKKLADKNNFKEVKALIINDDMWEEADYLLTLMEPVLVFLRDNDGNLTNAPGNSLGHAYYNFHLIDVFFKESLHVRDEHRGDLKTIIDARWVFAHTILHSAGFVLHPYYRLYKQDENRDVMNDFYRLADMWVNPHDKDKLYRQLCDYRMGRGMFARGQHSTLVNEPISFWQLFGAESPELKSFAIKILSQNTAASACETNWSSYEYIFNKRRNRLNTKTAEKLVYVHGNLKSLKAAEKIRPQKPGNGSSVKHCLEVLLQKEREFAVVSDHEDVQSDDESQPGPSSPSVSQATTEDEDEGTIRDSDDEHYRRHESNDSDNDLMREREQQEREADEILNSSNLGLTDDDDHDEDQDIVEQDTPDTQEVDIMT